MAPLPEPKYLPSSEPSCADPYVFPMETSRDALQNALQPHSSMISALDSRPAPPLGEALASIHRLSEPKRPEPDKYAALTETEIIKRVTDLNDSERQALKYSLAKRDSASVIEALVRLAEDRQADLARRCLALDAARAGCDSCDHELSISECVRRLVSDQTAPLELRIVAAHLYAPEDPAQARADEQTYLADRSIPLPVRALIATQLQEIDSRTALELVTELTTSLASKPLAPSFQSLDDTDMKRVAAALYLPGRADRLLPEIAGNVGLGGKPLLDEMLRTVSANGLSEYELQELVTSALDHISHVGLAGNDRAVDLAFELAASFSNNESIVAAATSWIGTHGNSTHAPLLLQIATTSNGPQTRTSAIAAAVTLDTTAALNWINNNFDRTCDNGFRGYLITTALTKGSSAALPTQLCEKIKAAAQAGKDVSFLIKGMGKYLDVAGVETITEIALQSNALPQNKQAVLECLASSDAKSPRVLEFAQNTLISADGNPFMQPLNGFDGEVSLATIVARWGFGANLGLVRTILQRPHIRTDQSIQILEALAKNPDDEATKISKELLTQLKDDRQALVLAQGLLSRGDDPGAITVLAEIAKKDNSYSTQAAQTVICSASSNSKAAYEAVNELIRDTEHGGRAAISAAIREPRVRDRFIELIENENIGHRGKLTQEILAYPTSLRRAFEFGIELPLRFSPDTLKRVTDQEYERRTVGAAQYSHTALVILPRRDSNGAFAGGLPLVEELLKRGYRVRLVDADSDTQVQAALLEMAQQGGADLIVPAAHSSRVAMSFGAADPRLNRKYDRSGAVDLWDGEKFNSPQVRAALKSGGKVIIDGCSAGEGFGARSNMANFWRAVFPHARAGGIHSPTKPITAIKEEDLRFDRNKEIESIEFYDRSGEKPKKIPAYHALGPVDERRERLLMSLAAGPSVFDTLVDSTVGQSNRKRRAA